MYLLIKDSRSYHDKLGLEYENKNHKIKTKSPVSSSRLFVGRSPASVLKREQWKKHNKKGPKEAWTALTKIML